VADRAQAIEVLHRRFAGVLYDHCVRMLGDRSEAEDAVQDTFLSAFRALDSFRYGESHLPWLYRIATNACLKIIRTRKRKGVELTETPERMADRPRDPVSDIHARRVVESLVDEIDDRSLEILVSHYVAGMDQGQIAGSLGISRRAVVKRLTKLRRRAGHLFEEGTTDG
jgi:RNA polymerase sigma-70 factor (ECF subfamily)